MRIRVLIVDDSLTIRALLATLFEEDDRFSVTGTACNAEEARDLLPHKLPDIVLLDHTMPGASGIDLLREIAADEGPPVVMVSAYMRPHCALRAQAMEAGAAACFDKNRLPGARRRLTNLVARIAEQAREAEDAPAISAAPVPPPSTDAAPPYRPMPAS